MPTPRLHKASSADRARRVGHELRAARALAGLTQRQVSRAANVSQSTVAKFELGSRLTTLALLHRVAAACGHDLVIKLYPAAGVSLRDSGQLAIAERMRSLVHERWRIRLEVAVGPPPERRAADMVLSLPDELLHVEIESALLDLQAQLRAAQLKRAVLATNSTVPVRLVLAVADTNRNRAAWALHRHLLTESLPLSSRTIYGALRSGSAIGGDGLLWVRGAPYPMTGMP